MSVARQADQELVAVPQAAPQRVHKAVGGTDHQQARPAKAKPQKKKVKPQRYIIIEGLARQVMVELHERYGDYAKLGRAIGKPKEQVRKYLTGDTKVMQVNTFKQFLALHGGPWTIRNFRTYSKVGLRKRGLHNAQTGIGVRSQDIYRYHEGRRQRRCRGPLHKGEFLDFDQFYVDGRNGMPRPWCKACELDKRGMKRWVPLSRVRFAILELVRRLGHEEAARRIGITSTRLRYLKQGTVRNVRYKTAEKTLRALAEVRAKNEVRHRDSIHHGARMRGRAEKKPRTKWDYYHPSGDSDAEAKRQQRVAEAK